jgi:hypothetical protein
VNLSSTDARVFQYNAIKLGGRHLSSLGMAPACAASVKDRVKGLHRKEFHGRHYSALSQ